jgi:hypothetical protein
MVEAQSIGLDIRSVILTMLVVEVLLYFKVSNLVASYCSFPVSNTIMGFETK